MKPDISSTDLIELLNERSHGPEVFKIGSGVYEVRFDPWMVVVIGISLVVFGYLSFSN